MLEIWWLTQPQKPATEMLPISQDRVTCGEKSIGAGERMYRDWEGRRALKNFIVVRWWKENIIYLFSDCTKILDHDFPRFIANKKDWDTLHISEDFALVLASISADFKRSINKKTQIWTFVMGWETKNFKIEFVKSDWIVYY